MTWVALTWRGDDRNQAVESSSRSQGQESEREHMYHEHTMPNPDFQNLTLHG